MKEKIITSVNDAIKAVSFLQLPSSLDFIEKGALLISECYREGGKVIIAGNGGSLCDANHFSEELVGIFRKPRQALPAIALSESGYLTTVGNDIGFDHIFSRGIEAYGKPKDIFIGLTTSGNSPNLIKAFMTAKKQGLSTIAFLGRGGGKLKGYADLELCIDGFSFSDRIQEAHMAAIHIMIEIVEEHLFYASETSFLKEIVHAIEG